MKALILVGCLLVGTGFAQNNADCNSLPNFNQLKDALSKVVKEGKQANSGLGNPEWGTIVNRDGVVCAVVFTGQDRSAEWPGSRLISAEKANTANAFSAPNFALSTANLYAASQPGQSLFGINMSAPPNPNAVFAGEPKDYGQANDPFVGKAIGGSIVFGGGLPLYDSKGKIVGGLGVSGDTACADHVIAWKTRHALNLDHVPMGPAPGQTDNMILDMQGDTSASGFGHPTCKGGIGPDEILKHLAEKFPTQK
ncbi:MAG: GlcG/HbpS family heme-binding protein [Terriglobales bacterium]